MNLDHIPDVLKQMKPLIVANNGHLDTEHRQTLASAYKHILNGLRRHLKAAASQLTTVEGSKLSAVVSEISRVCNEIIDLLRQWLIPAAAVGEESVFYWKLSVLGLLLASFLLTLYMQVR